MNKLAIVGHIKFEYNNWRGEDHVYEGSIESVEFSPKPIQYPESPNTAEESVRRKAEREAQPLVWLMHVNIHVRDGMVKPGRRTFIMSEMKNVKLRFAA